MNNIRIYYYLKGDRKIVRDIPAQSKDGVAVLPIVKYRLIVTTGNKKGAGSDANFSVRFVFD